MLQPDPDRRPPSMAEVLAWPVGDPTAGRRPSSAPSRRAYEEAAPRERKGSSRRWMALATVLLIAAAAGGGGAYYYFTTARLPPPGSRPNQARPIPPPDSRPNAGLPNSSADRPLPPPLSPQPGTPALDLPARPPGRVEDIRRYVDGYNGGECFFVAPVALGENAAALEGFGASTGPFESLDRAFKRQFGFEASIGVRQVTQPQCAAVSFLNRFRGEKAHSPRVQIGSTSLRSGETLEGSIENVGARRIELLLVSDAGTVQNISQFLKEGIDGKTFSLGMGRTDGAAGLQPQLLVAVASTGAVDALRQARSSPADQVFPLAATEAAQKQLKLQATARYFRLDR